MLRGALTILLALLPATLVMAQDDVTPPARLVVIADFTSPDSDDTGATYADALRMKLHRLDDWDTLDGLTTRDIQATPLGDDTDQAALKALAGATDADIAIAGTVTTEGDTVTLDVVVLDTATDEITRSTFTDNTQRTKAVITRAVVESLTGMELWTPPINDEPEPELIDPINADGDFESDDSPWRGLDNVSARIAPSDDTDRGEVLIIRTDFDRHAWLAYQTDLATGDASADDPPELPIDSGFGSVGGMEGVHVRSKWIAATPGARYWLTADMLGPAGCNARVFVKGFADLDAPIGLTETSLRERDMTPDDLSAMDPEARQVLLQADLDEHPERYRREVYRWYLACPNTSGDWEHFAAPFPPRDGLPEDVAWLRIDIFAAWPAGEYQFDNVGLYLAPDELPATTE